MPSRFQILVEKELQRVRDGGRKPFNSLHEAFAVLYEEVDELWDEVRKKTSQRNLPNALYELVQISAACARAAEDLLSEPLTDAFRELQEGAEEVF